MVFVLFMLVGCGGPSTEAVAAVDYTPLSGDDWVAESLRTYSEDARGFRVGSNFEDIGYGCQWWSVTVGEYRYNLAWGMPWKREKENLNVAADFISYLLGE